MKKSFPITSLKNYINVKGIEGDVIRKSYKINNMTLDATDKHTIIGDISVQEIDLDGDLIIAKGCDLSRFSEEPLIYYNHDYSHDSIGEGKSIQILDDRIRLKYTIGEDSYSQKAWSKVSSGEATYNSIGFIIKKALLRGTKAFSDYVDEMKLQITDKCTQIITNFMLVENSLCTMPINTMAENIMVTVKATEEPVVEPIKPVVEPIKEVVSPIIEPAKAIVEPVKEVIAPVIEPVKPIVEPIKDTIIIHRHGNYNIKAIKSNYDKLGIIIVS